GHGTDRHVTPGSGTCAWKVVPLRRVLPERRPRFTSYRVSAPDRDRHPPWVPV
ncbi:MAG: hypothetical protein AVDCRST_MAG34-1489, partial [uncultured Nocardioidaceae bacterium]